MSERPRCPCCKRPMPLRSLKPKPHERMAAGELARLRELAAAGATVEAIAADLGRSRSGVHRVMQALRRAGDLSLSPRLRNKRRPPPPPSAETRAALAAILARTSPEARP